MNDWVYELYKSNDEFKQFVDLICEEEKKGVFELLNSSFIITIAEEYRDKGDDV